MRSSTFVSPLLAVVAALAVGCANPNPVVDAGGDGGPTTDGAPDAAGSVPCRVTFTGALGNETDGCTMTLNHRGTQEVLSLGPGNPLGGILPQFAAAVSGSFSARTYGAADLDPTDSITIFGARGSTPVGTYVCDSTGGFVASGNVCPTFSLTLTSVDPNPPAGTIVFASATHGTADVTMLGGRAANTHGGFDPSPYPGTVVAHFVF